MCISAELSGGDPHQDALKEKCGKHGATPARQPNTQQTVQIQSISEDAEMTIRAGSDNGRTLLRGAIAAAAMVSFAVACGSPSSNDNGGGGAKKTATNPFGVAANSTVDAVIFNGGYGIDYVEFAADSLRPGARGRQRSRCRRRRRSPRSCSRASSAATRPT